MNSIKFLSSVELEVVTSIHNDVVESVLETFLKDDVLTEVLILNNDGVTTEIQFGNGSVAWFPNNSFVIQNEI